LRRQALDLLMSSRGAIVARLLAGSWRGPRSDTASLPSRAELDDVLPLLVDGGAAALAWARVRSSALADGAAAAQLRDARRMQALLAAQQQRQIAAALAALAAARVTALWAKGWTVARAYAEPSLRAVGDIDVYVAPAEHARAAQALAAVTGELDVHRGVPQLADRDFAALVARAIPVRVGAAAARVLAPADQLRLVCLHALGHGLGRPVWLCDVAALVEAGGVDWALCLEGDLRRARFVAAAVVAAAALLGADLTTVPASIRDTRLPSWLLPAILAAWSRPYERREPIGSYRHRLVELPAALRRRWPNPIEATVDIGAAFDEVPRWPIQVADCVVRVGRFARALAR
jgi:hypothetical protein